MKMNIESTTELNSGVKIPVIGLGTWQIEDRKTCENAVKWALETGYIHIDTALIYGNEKYVGNALHEYLEETGRSRDDIFITTKLWNDKHGYENAKKGLQTSLKNLRLDYVDLYLIHWPVPGRRVETWKAFEEMLKEGKTRAIGVSNFMKHHLAKLLPQVDIIPQINQIEFSPFLYLKELQNYCEENGIRIEAYSPLTHGKKLENPVLKTIAERYSKSSAQILIRWGLQRHLIEIPKSSSRNHIIENAKVFDFEINPEDMKTLDNLDEGWRSMSSKDWHPTAERWIE